MGHRGRGAGVRVCVGEETVKVALFSVRRVPCAVDVVRQHRLPTGVG